MDIAAITQNVTGNGERYLEIFLKEYTSIFQGKINPSCPKCLITYLDRYKNHFNAMTNKCNYKLHAKYENIPLEFGSPILVNNSNITDEYALKLLEHNNGERFFSQFPQKKKRLKKQTPEDSTIFTHDTSDNENA